MPSGTIQFAGQAGAEYSITGGAPYQAGTTFSGLAPGTYNPIVRTILSPTCTTSGAPVTINAVPTAPTVPTTASVTQPTCAVPSGTIVFNAQAGVQYSIDGTNYFASTTFSGVAPGTYTLSVRNLADTTCSTNAASNVIINAVPTAPITPTTASVTQPTCGTPSGTIVINIQSGVQYSVNGVGGPYFVSNTFSGLLPGSYNIVVRNTADSTCSASGSTSITINAVPTAPAVPTAASVTQPTCATPSGTIVFTTQAGVEYSVNGINYFPSNTFSGLPQGTYTLNVRNPFGYNM